MNRMILGVWLMAVAFQASAQQENNYTITGLIQGFDVQEVYLSYFTSSGLRTDSARVVDHQYSLSGQTASGVVATLTSAGPDVLPMPDNTVSIFLSPSEHFTVTHTNTFAHMSIIGSPANKEYVAILERQKLFDRQQKELEVKLGKAIQVKDKTGEKKIRGEMAETKANQNEFVYGDYMRANPASPLLAFAFNNYIGDPRRLGSSDVAKVQPLFNMLSDTLRHSAGGKAFQEQLDKLVVFDQSVGIGKQAPDFTQNDTAGHPVTFSSFRGKYVLLDFWASWCGPCRQENPGVVAAYQKYHGKGFEIVGVSLDQSGASWKKAIRDDKLGWIHVSDLQYWNNALVKVYGIQGVPQNFLIDPQGKIVARGLRGEELDSKLAEIYRSILPE